MGKLDALPVRVIIEPTSEQTLVVAVVEVILKTGQVKVKTIFPAPPLPPDLSVLFVA